MVAQLVEQYTFNVWALGSSPSQITKKSKPPFFGGFAFQKIIIKNLYSKPNQRSTVEHPDFNREGPGFEYQPDHYPGRVFCFMPCVYIIYSEKLNKFYVGACTDIERRLYQLNS